MIKNIRQELTKLSNNDFPFAKNLEDSSWTLTHGKNWTEGFWIGMIWDAYELTGDDYFLKRATKYEKSIKNRCQDASTHDIGFLFSLSALKGIQVLKNKKIDSELYDYFYNDLECAVRTLISSYEREVGLIPAWKYQGKNVFLIDTFMNLEVLLWYSKESKNSKLLSFVKEIGMKIDKIFIKKNGSVIPAFIEIAPGKFKEWRNQGYKPGSSWSRGIGWALCGNENFYRETGDLYFRKVFYEILNYYKNAVGFHDIPKYDIDDPRKKVPKDASAAAIILFSLSSFYELTNDKFMLKEAKKLLKTIFLQAMDEKSRLVHCCYHYPQRYFIDSETIWGDYYLMESLKKLNGIN